MATIYMRLLDEGEVAWRPVDATPVSLDTFRVEGEIPDGEVWEFAPGTVVRCERIDVQQRQDRPEGHRRS